MTSDPLFYVGLAFFGAAIVGGGLKLAGTEIPVLKSGVRQLLAGALGLGIIYVAYDSHHFRVTDLRLASVGVYRGACPSRKTFDFTIVTKGGDGTVEYRVRTPTYNSPLYQAKGSGRLVYEGFVPIYRSGSGSAWLNVLTPSEKQSARVPYTVVCTSYTQAAAPALQTPIQKP
jgi:hypothetical protein